MAQPRREDTLEGRRIELSATGNGLVMSSQSQSPDAQHDLSLGSENGGNLDEESAQQWTVIERLPTVERLRWSLFDDKNGSEPNNERKRRRIVDVTKLSVPEKHMLIEKLIRDVEHDNLRLLQQIRERMDKVGIKIPSIEVRYQNLHVAAECEVVDGKPLPSMWNSLKSLTLNLVRLPCLKSQFSKINIINDVSGIIKPGRLTLLLGPPGGGKTTLLKALSGILSKSLQVTGEISYNGYRLTEFVPRKLLST